MTPTNEPRSADGPEDSASDRASDEQGGGDGAAAGSPSSDGSGCPGLILVTETLSDPLPVLLPDVPLEPAGDRPATAAPRSGPASPRTAATPFGWAECTPGDDRFQGLLAEAAALVVRTATRVDDAMLAAAPRLRVVGRAGVGVDTIDLEACRRRGIAVVNTPGANTQAVVELVLRVVLEAIRPVPLVTAPLSRADWAALRDSAEADRQLDERTIGILGLGRIGSRLAKVLGALGCRVLYEDLRSIPPEDRHGAQPVDRATLMAESDVLSVHVDGRPANRGLLGPADLDRLRPEAILVNASRGFVIDPDALAAALRARPAALALLDVHEPEPLPAGHPLLGLPNVRLSPHIGGKTRTASRRMCLVVEDVVAVLEGRPPRHAVVPPPAGR